MLKNYIPYEIHTRKLYSTDDGSPTDRVDLDFNPRRAMVMTHIQRSRTKVTWFKG